MEEDTKSGNGFIAWTPALSVGINFIDDQHKTLVHLINDLSAHTEGDSKSERLYSKDIISKLLDYAKVHFTTEEDLMQQTGFQGFEQHKKEHESFVLKVVDLVKDYNQCKPMALETLTDFLKEWILRHVAGTDKRYSNHFLEHGISAEEPFFAERKGSGRIMRRFQN